MTVLFDGINKRVIVSEASSIDIKKDIYSNWKRWVQSANNAKYAQALRTVGGDDIGSGQKAPPYFFLMNNWKVLVDGIHVNFFSNLYCEEATNNDFSPFIIINNGSVSNKVSDSPIVSTGSGLSQDEHNTLFNMPANVWSHTQ